MNDKYILDFCCNFSHCDAYLLYGKVNEDVVLHCHIEDEKINDDTGILRPKQSDRRKCIDIFK